MIPASFKPSEICLKTVNQVIWSPVNAIVFPLHMRQHCDYLPAVVKIYFSSGFMPHFCDTLFEILVVFLTGLRVLDMRHLGLKLSDKLSKC